MTLLQIAKIMRENEVVSIHALAFKFAYESLIFMQFTGLHDKNGKEIFEGDCFRNPVSINNSLHGDWSIYQFIMKNGFVLCSYVRSEKQTGIPVGYMACPFDDIFDIDMKSSIFADSVTLEDCEVIGNIHQNPELL